LKTAKRNLIEIRWLVLDMNHENERTGYSWRVIEATNQASCIASSLTSGPKRFEVLDRVSQQRARFV